MDNHSNFFRTKAKTVVHSHICESSELLSANTLINSGTSLLVGAKVFTDGTNDATLVIKDGTDSGGTVKDKVILSGDENYGGGLFPCLVKFDDGIYCEISGTGAEFIIYYVNIEE